MTDLLEQTLDRLRASGVQSVEEVRDAPELLLAEGDFDVLGRLILSGEDGERDGLARLHAREFAGHDHWEFVRLVPAFEQLAVDFDDLHADF